jgi:hypothetical protein
MRFAAVVREVHFAASLAVGVLLTFFALTGFMAEHREWFHERVERADLGVRVALAEGCGAAAVARLAGSEPWPAPSGWVGAAGGGRVALCREGADHAFVGVEGALAGTEDPLQRLGDVVGGRRDDGGSPLPDGMTRWSTVWAVDTVHLHPDGVRYAVFTLDMPLAWSLIELHRGRGSTERVLDVTVGLVVVTVVSGLLHGLRGGVSRRRWMAALGVVAVTLLGVLVAG